MREGRPFDSVAARHAWNNASDSWDDFVESGADYSRTEVHGPALLGACGEVERLPIFDLGCGQEFFSRQLAAGGAQVIGIDLADQQIARARQHEDQNPLGIEYHLMDAAQIAEH